VKRGADYLGLAVCLFVALAAGAVGGIGSAQAGEFYQSLDLPSWAPPAGVFGPVWTVLYLCMALSSWLVWRTQSPQRSSALGFYIVQLVINSLWSWLFFAWRQGLWAFIEILALWVLIVATMTLFWRVRRLAAAVLIPYLLWVSFAAFLAYSAWRRNPALLS